MLSALAAEPGARLPGARRHECRALADSKGVEVPLSLIEKLEGFATAQ